MLWTRLKKAGHGQGAPGQGPPCVPGSDLRVRLASSGPRGGGGCSAAPSEWGARWCPQLRPGCCPPRACVGEASSSGRRSVNHPEACSSLGLAQECRPARFPASSLSLGLAVPRGCSDCQAGAGAEAQSGGHPARCRPGYGLPVSPLGFILPPLPRAPTTPCAIQAELAAGKGLPGCRGPAAPSSCPSPWTPGPGPSHSPFLSSPVPTHPPRPHHPSTALLLAAWSLCPGHSCPCQGPFTLFPCLLSAELHGLGPSRLCPCRPGAGGAGAQVALE